MLCNNVKIEEIITIGSPLDMLAEGRKIKFSIINYGFDEDRYGIKFFINLQDERMIYSVYISGYLTKSICEEIDGEEVKLIISRDDWNESSTTLRSFLKSSPKIAFGKGSHLFYLHETSVDYNMNL